MQEFGECVSMFLTEKPIKFYISIFNLFVKKLSVHAFLKLHAPKVENKLNSNNNKKTSCYNAG